MLYLMHNNLTKCLILPGYIHGDLNEHNILVHSIHKSGPTHDAMSLEMSGILDFQDAKLSHPMYDLAIAITYTMLVATTFDPMEIGGHVLAG